MKGRYLSSVFIAAIVLLFSSLPAYSQNVAGLLQDAAKGKRAKPVPQDRPKLNAAGIYVVRPGDSLYKIARTFRTTPETLISANRLQSNKIKPGQKIAVPGARNTAAETDIAKSLRVPLPSYDEAGNPSMSRLRETDQALEGEDQPLRLQLIKAGFELLGVNYRYSGMSAKSGFDCSGLVKSLFSKFNIELPRSSKEQYKQGEKVERGELEMGDLVFFSSGGKSPNHVGIYIGNDKFIHAERTARKVIITDLNKIWYTVRYLGARRIADLWREEPSTAENPPK